MAATWQAALLARIRGLAMKVYNVYRNGISGRASDLAGISLGDCELLWVEAEDPDEDELSLLREFFSLHPLVLEMAREAQAIPRMQEFEDHILVAWEFARDDPTTENIETVPVYMVLGGNYLLTLHADAIPEISSIFDKLGADPRMSHRHPAFILYAIMDEAVDQLFPLVEELKDRIDAYTDELLADGGKGLGEVMHYKHRNMALRRTVSALRDVVMRLARRDLALVPEDLNAYLMDVFDHLTRIYLETDNNSDLITSALDIHLGVVSNRLNVTMKRLTAVATFFMPATFLAGVYGMNFAHLPEVHWYYGYLFFWLLVIVLTAALFFVARRQDWL